MNTPTGTALSWLPPHKIIVASLEGIKIEVYRTHATRWLLDFSKDPGGEWHYENTFATSPDVWDRLFYGINEFDAREIRAAITEAQRAR